MRFTVDLIISFLLLGLIEALIKPMARTFVRRRLVSVAPAVLERLDSSLPVVLGRASGEEIENYTRRVLYELTKEDWSNTNIEPLFQQFDIRRAADALISKNSQN